MPNLSKPFKPTLSLFFLAGLATLCLNATAQQVYESTDEQGNVTFSDTPTEGSREVTIEAPNVGDAVKVPPPSPETEEAPKPKAATDSGEVPPELSTTDNDAVDVEGDDWVYRNRLYDKDRYNYDRRRHRSWYPHKEPRGGR